MTAKKFDSSVLTPTQWSTVADKIKFANQFVRFVESGFSFGSFPKWFYTRLSLCFGFIAHYNQVGFYEWVKDNPVAFMRDVATYDRYGSPSWTYSDIEKQLAEYAKNWLKRNGV